MYKFIMYLQVIGQQVRKECTCYLSDDQSLAVGGNKSN
jgi:hypothetical protein